MKKLDASVNGLPDPGNSWRTVNRALGVTSGIMLDAGIGLLARFAYLNAPFK